MTLLPSDSQEDLYIGKTVSQMILLLGKPTGKGFRVIDENYRGYESEPDYSMYFSLEERRATVTIKILEWAKKSEHIVVWAKRVDEEWEVFSSLNRKKGVLY